MSEYPDARFLKSADAARQFVPDDGAEVAVAGRSNAGKSSAINCIVNRRGFARTSRTPGRTRLVNFFSLGGERRLVDLPGYGFARVAGKQQEHWAELLTGYILDRRSLLGLLLIVDIRRRLTDYDRRMLELAWQAGLQVHILATKADKLKRGQVASALQEIAAEIGERATVQAFSALKKTGVGEARARLGELLCGIRGE